MIVCNHGIGPRTVVEGFLSRLPALVSDEAAKVQLRELNRREGLSVTQKALAATALVSMKDVLARIQYATPEGQARHKGVERESGLRFSQRVYQDLLADGLLERDFVQEIERVECPALVIGGAKDVMPTLEEVRALHTALPNSRLELFEHSGHFPYVEEPERFLHVASGFLAGTRS
jgi:pimeloyl-ACP methyl ester carboxylesterase